MQFWHLVLTFATAKASIASPIGSATQGEADAAIIDEIIAKYNLTDAGMTSPTEPKFSKRDEKCYSDDWRWDTEYNLALDRAGRWCSGNGGSGRYLPGQIKNGCYNLNTLKRVNFRIQNRQDRAIDLSSGACFRFLRGVINACDRGGENENGAWWWTADSNIGTC